MDVLTPGEEKDLVWATRAQETMLGLPDAGDHVVPWESITRKNGLYFVFCRAPRTEMKQEINKTFNSRLLKLENFNKALQLNCEYGA